MGRKELLAEVEELATAVYALLVLTFQLDNAKRQDLVSIFRSLDVATTMQLRVSRETISKNLRTLSKLVGCKLDRTDLARTYQDLFGGGFRFTHIPKWRLDAAYFDRFGEIWPGWENLPAHALIPFDPSGAYLGPGERQYYLPEAALFEDMCFAYNNSLAQKDRAGRPPYDKKIVKAHSFFMRAALLSAFYFVEAYLNGVAFDFVLKNRNPLGQEALDRLLEWDSKKKRQRWVKFRDKALQYPKIILGQKDPPLHEANCSELATLIERGREVRDAIVHQSPKPDFETRRPEKVRGMMQISQELVTEVVDASIGFVRKVNALLAVHGEDLSWLCDRETTGLFPDKVFD